VDVNSFHHQAVSELGAGPARRGRAVDGTIEAIEDRRASSSCGVQWHAETLVGRGAHLAHSSGARREPRAGRATLAVAA
jgi:putative glutamine amidotransferase